MTNVEGVYDDQKLITEINLDLETLLNGKLFKAV